MRILFGRTSRRNLLATVTLTLWVAAMVSCSLPCVAGAGGMHKCCCKRAAGCPAPARGKSCCVTAPQPDPAATTAAADAGYSPIESAGPLAVGPLAPEPALCGVLAFGPSPPPLLASTTVLRI